MLTANEPANVKNRLIPRRRVKSNYNSIFGSAGEGEVEERMPLKIMPLIKIGDRAPDFELSAIAGERHFVMRSRDYLGRQNLVVAFHPLDWTPT
jgi:hypothetical protein